MGLPRGWALGWGPEVLLLLLPECSWHTCPPLPLQWVPLMAVHLPRSRPLIRLVKLNPAK